MTRKHKTLLFLSIGLVIWVTFAFAKKQKEELYFDIPKGWPKPNYDFSKNLLTEEGFQLGRNLFYDPIISRDSTISCASCHLQQTGFTHVDHDLSHGIDGKIGTRNSLTIQNLAWSKTFMWDGGVNHLDVQAIAPITSKEEMDETMENVVKKLQKFENYKSLYKNAFGKDKITGQLTLKALSQFMVMLVSSNSKYDKVMRKEETFSNREQNGYEIFKNKCVSCHTEPLFTNQKFERNGLEIDDEIKDLGRYVITKNPKDSLKFKVPTLRNITYTFPYMHDGRLKTLKEVIEHYNTIKPNKNLPKELKNPMNITNSDKIDLLLFLSTLTDKEFLNNPRFGFPKK
jgi:cytochrome c peroxidase